MVSWLHPEPAAPAFGGEEVVAEARSSPLNKLILQWLSPLLDVGFSRPLEKNDLWQLPDAKLTGALAAQVEANFYARVPPEDRPAAYRPRPSSETVLDTEKDIEKDAEKDEKPAIDEAEASTLPGVKTEPTPPKKADKKYDRSLTKALHATFWKRWWLAGLARLVADTLKTTSPLVNKALLTWLTEVYIYYRLPEEAKPFFPGGAPRGIGYGIGLVFALFAMQEVSSLFTQHYQFTALTTGMMVRGSVIGAIFRKSLRLSGRSRNEHSAGQITTMISSDTTRLDMSSAYFHVAWIAPIQIAIGIGLLIYNLGYSALVGLGVLVLGFPFQGILVAIIFKQRTKGVKITDQRVRLTNEILQGIRLIKYFSWEPFYADQINALRAQELKTIRKFSLAFAAMIGSVTFIPILASILSFITYYLTGHDLNVAIIFTSLQFFNIIRQPLILLPIVLSSVANAVVALRRIGEFLNAEEMPAPYEMDKASDTAVSLDADFAWEVAAESATAGVKDKKGATAKEKKAAAAKEKKEKKAKKGKSDLPSTTQDVAATGDEKEKEKEPEKPFELRGLKLNIPKGAFVAIVGRIGSGKSSLLQGIFGEMRRTRGNVTVGGSLAYVPQTAWIMNATVRENILFGAEDDEAKFRRVVQACSLEHDLEMLPHHEQTEIGERGINISGGQKARVSVARAAYSDSDIILLDDCLSAVDAHVAKALTDNLLLKGPLASKTRILATHSLSVLPKVDYIYVLDQGAIVEEGVYSDLIARGAAFSKLVEEYGSRGDDEAQAKDRTKKDAGEKTEEKTDDLKAGKDNLMQTEERVTGAVTLQTYIKYLRFGGSVLWAPTIIMLLILSQMANVGNSLFLSFWTDQSLGLTQSGYMGAYAGLGAATAVTSFAVSYAFSLMSVTAGFSMFRASLNGVLHSPVSWFDTTPVGRIISRLSKDQDTVDQELSGTMWNLSFNFMMILGTVALVFYTFPYLGIMFLPLAILYYYIALFYRRTSVEVKRLDSLMRSALYASYNETLTGVATVRAYGGQERFVTAADQRLDMENRAYYMTIAIQSWLGIRLDALGNLLILGIGLFAAGQAKWTHAVQPGKIGLVLTYALGITQVFSEMVSSYARNEQNMNAVERVLVYTELPAEGEKTKGIEPPPSWPSAGSIKFNDVQLAYRPELPLVLKGINFEVRPREKIGIVGRTGAGKSSLMQALFRIVELQGGNVQIDDVDIATLDLAGLRSGLAFVPQDSVLFLGSLRDNLDPTRSRTDAEVISALQRAWLLPRDGTKDPIAEAKFGLNSSVGDDGSNYSAGERQLLALCRALVKGSRIIVLDEATSNVDVETDAKIQKTIQTEFADSTLLCIAHRLNTIAYYDRILVLDAGQVAEFDTPLALFDQEEGIFRSLCEEAGLSRQDIERIRASVGR